VEHDDAWLVRAAARNHASWMNHVALATGGGRGRRGRLRWVANGTGEAGVPFPRLPSSPALDALLDWCHEREVRRIGVWATGLEDVHPLAARLLPRGFGWGWQPHWMTIAAADLPGDAPDPRVAIVRQVPEYDAYGQALLRLTGGRSWHAVARVEGGFAGRAWAHRVGDHVGVYDVEVWPRFRRRGLGRALTLAVCRAAGGTCALLNATGEGEALYAALGFRSLGYGQTWWWHRAG